MKDLKLSDCIADDCEPSPCNATCCHRPPEAVPQSCQRLRRSPQATQDLTCQVSLVLYYKYQGNQRSGCVCLKPFLHGDHELHPRRLHRGSNHITRSQSRLFSPLISACGGLRVTRVIPSSQHPPAPLRYARTLSSMTCMTGMAQGLVRRTSSE